MKIFVPIRPSRRNVIDDDDDDDEW